MKMKNWQMRIYIYIYEITNYFWKQKVWKKNMFISKLINNSQINNHHTKFLMLAFPYELQLQILYQSVAKRNNICYNIV